MLSGLPRWFSGALLLAACAPAQKDSDPSPPGVELLETEQILPGPGIPDSVAQQDSRNNLDVVRHGERIFLAFRTAPSHFASALTELYVLSSADGDVWTQEASVSMGTDLREPRFLSWDGRLFLYFAVLGDNAADFEPQGARAMERQPDGAWGAPSGLMEAQIDFIPWRARVVTAGGRAVPTLIGYTGGGDIYDAGEASLDVHLLTTTDGLAWSGYVPDQPVVATGGGSETDWVVLEDGGLLAVSRNEAGDAGGFGAKICTAPPDAPGDWGCVSDPKKYDSPLMFRRGGRNWLVGRRNVTETGWYDLGMDDLSLEAQRQQYEIAYWIEPKRCALWEVDAERRAVSFVLDLPSKGDTCFPSMLEDPDDPQSVWIYNYSSPIDGPDLAWNEGQAGETFIYRHRLRFPG